MDGICPVDEGSRPPAKEGLCACVHNETVYVLSGRDPSSPYTPQSTIHTLDTESKVWTKMTSRGEATPPFTAGSSCVAIGNRIYTFGGWLRGAVNNQIHEFNIETKTWKHLEPYDTAHQPMMKNKQGMVAHGDDALLIFGGYGEPAIGASLQKGADYVIDNSSLWFSLLWTNELHLFRIRKREWVEPEVTGPRPKPCAAFSFNRIDKERVVVFGGRQKEERINEMHILDTSNWCWSGVLLPTSPDEPWPSKRSFHTACTLIDPDLISTNTDTNKSHFLLKQNLLLLWGNDNNGDVVKDCWILEIEAKQGNAPKWKWKKFPVPESVMSRTWACTTSVYNTPSLGETLVLTIGGSLENLFITENPQIAEEPLLMSFGCPTLYQFCKRSVIALFPDLSVISSLLPQRVYKELETLKLIERDTIKCNNLLLS